MSKPRTMAPWVPLLIATAVGSVVMALVSPKFLTSFNIFVILQGAATFALLGFAVMVVLAVRDITLAVGGIGSFTAVLFGWMVQGVGVPAVVAVLLAVLAGAVVGALNGLIITRSGLTGFVVTLATGAALSGAALGMTRATAFTAIPESWTGFGQGRWGFFPFIALLTLVVAAALFVLYRFTPFGRGMLAAGGNPEAATLAGISIPRQIVAAHVMSGMLAALAAVVFVGRLGSASPDLGTTWVLVSFAVPIIGGTALGGGRISVPGAIIAAVVLSTINDALILLNVSQYGVLFAQGLLILLAVVAGRLGNFGVLRRRAKEATA